MDPCNDENFHSAFYFESRENVHLKRHTAVCELVMFNELQVVVMTILITPT